MKIKLKDFCGEIEWFACGDRLFFDKSMTYLAQLIASSQKEITDLASVVQNMPVDEQTQVPLLKNLIKKTNFKYEQLYISCPNGDYFNADAQKNNILDRHYFDLVMQGQTVISEPIINKSTGRLVIAVATPIWQNGKINGLFGATIKLDSLNEGKKTDMLKKRLKKVHKYKNRAKKIEAYYFHKIA